MFGKKPLLKKRKASAVAHHMVSVVDGVEELIRLNAISIEGNSLFIYKELLTGTHSTKDYVKNLYLYCRTKKLLDKGQTLYIKDIESTNIIAQYTNEKALLFL